MTGNDLLNFALAHMGEASSAASDYLGYAIPAINVLLSECFDINNSIREYKKLKPLKEHPFIQKLDEEIPYEQELMVECLSYGLAAKLILEDNDYPKFNYYNGMYIQAQQNCQYVKLHKIIDRFGGDES